MTVQAALPSRVRAELLYQQARADIDVNLWRAALGSGSGPSTTPAQTVVRPRAGIDALLMILGQQEVTQDAGGAAAPTPAAAVAPQVSPARTGSAEPGLGVNGQYASTIEEAASRTGIPAPALAAIIDAEAAKNGSGQWQTGSSNPRSTAVGLGQFLAGTWQSEAQRAGTWLNGVAHANGWIGDQGAVRPGARAALLALRQDASASINATADYSRRNLDTLQQAGVVVGQSIEQIAHTAYLGHNLGVRDALNFMRGSIGEGRAKLLLEAQVGVGHAARRIAEAGGAILAHREWLTNFIGSRVRPDRFGA